MKLYVWWLDSPVLITNQWFISPTKHTGTALSEKKTIIAKITYVGERWAYSIDSLVYLQTNERSQDYEAINYMEIHIHILYD